MSLLIYGVTGYTGNLVVKEAVAKGLSPVVAGRNEKKVQKVANLYGLQFKVFSLDNIATIYENIRGFKAVLHLAGPFRDTARPMAEACLQAGCHYMDITGEIAILEWMRNKNDEAIRANVMLMCGTGFDLVPTDCVAMELKQRMPAASHLELAFYMPGGGISHGTMATSVNNLGSGGFTRKNGNLIYERLGKNGKSFTFKDQIKFCISIPWGDLVTAYESTSIPNIQVFLASSKKVFYFLKFQWLFNWILRLRFTKKLLHRYVDKNYTGPSEQQNFTCKTFIYGKVHNEKGEINEALLQCPESYYLTALASVLIASKVLQGNFKPGFQTPAGAYGANLILEIPGCLYI